MSSGLFDSPPSYEWGPQAVTVGNSSGQTANQTQNNTSQQQSNAYTGAFSGLGQAVGQQATNIVNGAFGMTPDIPAQMQSGLASLTNLNNGSYMAGQQGYANQAAGAATDSAAYGQAAGALGQPVTNQNVNVSGRIDSYANTPVTAQTVNLGTDLDRLRQITGTASAQQVNVDPYIQALSGANPKAQQVSAGSFDDAARQKYESPYLSSVYKTQMDSFDRDAAVKQAQLDASLGASKAFGSSGTLAKLTATSNDQRNRAATSAATLQKGFEDAQAQFNADAGRKLTADTSNQSADLQAQSMGLDAKKAAASTALSQGTANQSANLQAQQIGLSAAQGAANANLAQQQSNQSANLDAQKATQQAKQTAAAQDLQQQTQNQNANLQAQAQGTARAQAAGQLDLADRGLDVTAAQAAAGIKTQAQQTQAANTTAQVNAGNTVFQAGVKQQELALENLNAGTAALGKGTTTTVTNGAQQGSNNTQQVASATGSNTTQQPIPVGPGTGTGGNMTGGGSSTPTGSDPSRPSTVPDNATWDPTSKTWKTPDGAEFNGSGWTSSSLPKGADGKPQSFSTIDALNQALGSLGLPTIQKPSGSGAGTGTQTGTGKGFTSYGSDPNSGVKYDPKSGDKPYSMVDANGQPIKDANGNPLAFKTLQELEQYKAAHPSNPGGTTPTPGTGDGTTTPPKEDTVGTGTDQGNPVGSGQTDPNGYNMPDGVPAGSTYDPNTGTWTDAKGVSYGADGKPTNLDAGSVKLNPDGTATGSVSSGQFKGQQVAFQPATGGRAYNQITINGMGYYFNKDGTFSYATASGGMLGTILNSGDLTRNNPGFMDYLQQVYNGISARAGYKDGGQTPVAEGQAGISLSPYADALMRRRAESDALMQATMEGAPRFAEGGQMDDEDDALSGAFSKQPIGLQGSNAFALKAAAPAKMGGMESGAKVDGVDTLLSKVMRQAESVNASSLQGGNLDGISSDVADAGTFRQPTAAIGKSIKNGALAGDAEAMNAQRGLLREGAPKLDQTRDSGFADFTGLQDTPANRYYMNYLANFPNARFAALGKAYRASMGDTRQRQVDSYSAAKNAVDINSQLAKNVQEGATAATTTEAFVRNGGLTPLQQADLILRKQQIKTAEEDAFRKRNEGKAPLTSGEGAVGDNEKAITEARNGVITGQGGADLAQEVLDIMPLDTTGYALPAADHKEGLIPSLADIQSKASNAWRTLGFGDGAIANRNAKIDQLASKMVFQGYKDTPGLNRLTNMEAGLFNTAQTARSTGDVEAYRRSVIALDNLHALHNAAMAGYDAEVAKLPKGPDGQVEPRLKPNFTTYLEAQLHRFTPNESAPVITQKAQLDTAMGAYLATVPAEKKAGAQAAIDGMFAKAAAGTDRRARYESQLALDAVLGRGAYQTMRKLRGSGAAPGTVPGQIPAAPGPAAPTDQADAGPSVDMNLP